VNIKWTERAGRKGTTNHKHISDQQRMKQPFMAGVSALGSFQYSDTIAWKTGTPCEPQKLGLSNH